MTVRQDFHLRDVVDASWEKGEPRLPKQRLIDGLEKFLAQVRKWPEGTTWTYNCTWDTDDWIEVFKP